MIPIEKAVILWETDYDLPRGQRVTAVHICEHADVPKPGEPNDLTNIRGACDADWLSASEFTPLCIFAYISGVEGFANEIVRALAFEEFGKIEGQDWATDFRRELP